jgi:hypothetical protein
LLQLSEKFSAFIFCSFSLKTVLIFQPADERDHAEAQKEMVRDPPSNIYDVRALQRCRCCASSAFWFSPFDSSASGNSSEYRHITGQRGLQGNSRALHSPR